MRACVHPNIQTSKTPQSKSVNKYRRTHVAGLSTSAASTVAGPTSQSKKSGVMRALNSQARREEPGNRVRKIWLKPCWFSFSFWVVCL